MVLFNFSCRKRFTMKMKHKINIDLLEFIRTGKFDYLKIGQTRDWVLNNFPNPDGFEDGDNWRNGEFEIFTYGDIELHFSNDILYLIFADHFDKIQAGKSIDLTNKWVFEKDTSSLSLPFVIQSLLAEKIDFSTKYNGSLNCLTVKTVGNVSLHFESDDSDNPNDFMFIAICLNGK